MSLLWCSTVSTFRLVSKHSLWSENVRLRLFRFLSTFLSPCRIDFVVNWNIFSLVVDVGEQELLRKTDTSFRLNHCQLSAISLSRHRWIITHVLALITWLKKRWFDIIRSSPTRSRRWERKRDINISWYDKLNTSVNNVEIQRLRWSSRFRITLGSLDWIQCSRRFEQ